jgi:hypothetical protein
VWLTAAAVLAIMFFVSLFIQNISSGLI